MIGHDDEEILGPKTRRRFSDDPVDFDVQIFHDRSVGEICGGERRVPGIHGAPHHVRYLIDVAKVVEQKPIVEPIEDVSILTQVLIPGNPRLREKLVWRENAGLQAFRVFWHALRVKAAGGAGQFGRIVGRRRDRQRRFHRVEIDRADIQLEIRVERLR